MDFLKMLFNEKALTFDELVQAINAHNGNEANKDKQIKVANLGGGEYVGKAKYEALQALLDGKDQELTAANSLIEGFKKSEKGNEAMQGKITEYEGTITELQKQLVQTQIDSGLKIAFLEAGATDIDYLTFKAKSGDKALEMGEDGKIKGVDDLISGLKTQFPNQFKKADNGGFKVDPQPLPNGDDRKAEPQNLADALRMQYEGK